MHFVLAESSIQLVPDATLLLHLVMIAVMVLILNRTLLKPVNRILSEREKQIRTGLSAAEALAAERAAKMQEYDRALREARGEGYRLLEKERAQALTAKEQRVRAARETIHQTVATTVNSTKEQQIKVAAELEVQAQTLGDQISQQILRSH